ncbi:retinol dehydrogenase 12 [Aspergillus udagawae]|uniref:Retinol dehydrogenase 12 n=1 Tax=Aspergillus udagawae TaxID=91492 RepID=A0ABQ1A9R8_9EURO|nr:retinol dehydrogenase 12 [Aspergillus udagawae]GFF76961.1 retinol dehydrogenase 12 [Aspergillus udagawae]GFG04696.1 retinol dehydrogenase 12 [Aspergillus udagawae]GFG21153.1 retinol dehydrogenase 12 [Aspergillus udagawae]
MEDHPTALSIIQTENLTHALPDKVILITGCSSGLGAATARALSKTNATLFLAVRDIPKARHVLADLLAPAADSDSSSDSTPASDENSNPSSPQGEIRLLHMDVTSLSSIRQAVNSFLSQSDKLNVLINNGGVMATPEGRTEDGFEIQFGTNHLGHFLLFELLKPILLRSVTPQFHSRVVGVTSSAHRKSGIRFRDLQFELGGYDPALAYAQSKTANIYMMNEIERRFGGLGLHGLSVHPGHIFTGLQKFVDDGVMEEWRKPGMKPYLKTEEQGAATVVVAAVGREWEGKGGKYLENCRESELAKPGFRTVDPGYASHIWDQESAERLWEESRRLVGLRED